MTANPFLRGGAGLLLGVAALAAAMPILLGREPTLGIVLDGAVIGSLTGLLAVGLILVHRATGVVNFGQASMGSLPAVTGLVTAGTFHLPYLAAVGIMLGSVPIVGLAVNAVMRRFDSAPRLIATVATLGIAQLLAFFEIEVPLWIGGAKALGEKPRTPFSSFRFGISTVIFNGNDIVAVGVVVVALVSISVFLKRSRVGLAIRASAENVDRAALLGIPVRRLSAVVWVLATLLSALGVFLRAPLVGLPNGSLLSYNLLLAGLTAAVVARMDNVFLAFSVAVGIGVIDQSAFFVEGNSALGVGILLPITLVALLFRRSRGRADDTGVSSFRIVSEPPRVPAALHRLPEVVALRWATFTVAAGVAVALPWIFAVTENADFASDAVVLAILCVSGVVLTGWAGQISLGQFGFAAVGALVAGELSTNLHQDFSVCLIAASLAGAVAAVALGIPALRLPGLFLAVVTLAFSGFAVTYLLDPTQVPWLFPALDGGQVLRPILWGRIDVTSPYRFYFVCLTMLLVVLAAARALRRSRTGRLLIAARDNPKAAQAYGVALARAKLAGFAVSGAMAALGGALLAFVVNVVNADGFTVNDSVTVFLTAVVGGIAALPGALLGALYFTVFAYIIHGAYSLLATGIGLTLLLLFFPGGLAEIAYRIRDIAVAAAARRHGLDSSGAALTGTPKTPAPLDVPPVLVAA